METIDSYVSKEKNKKGSIKSLGRMLSSVVLLSCCGGQRKRLNKAEDKEIKESGIERYERFGLIDGEEKAEKRRDGQESPELIPLRQFQRYTITASEDCKFQQRRLFYPQKAIYEVEWEKGHWLQFDTHTNEYIESLRAKGFTKVAVRNDVCLRKHISYHASSPIDILLELSLEPAMYDRKKELAPQPILCHQPTSFALRRTQWWQTTYDIGQACLPKWVDPDLCCNAMLMNAPSVMAVMESISRSSSCFFQKPVDALHSSTHTSLSSNPSSPWFKPLKYHSPVFSDTLSEPTLVY